jgi:hypothetical protein
MDQDKISNLYRGPSIDATYQISVHFGKHFQKSTNQKQEVSVHLDMRFQRGRFKKIGQSETRIACGGHVC